MDNFELYEDITHHANKLLRQPYMLSRYLAMDDSDGANWLIVTALSLMGFAMEDIKQVFRDTDLSARVRELVVNV